MAGVVTKVAFNKLPRVVRERLVGILQKRGDPTIVRFEGGNTDFPKVMAFFSIVGTLAALFIAQWLWKEDSRKDAYFDREIYWMMAGVLWLTLIFAVSLVYRKFWPPPAWPVGAKLIWGGYLMYVDRGYVLIHRLTATVPTITNMYRNGVYQGARLTFDTGQQLLSYGCKTEKEADEILQRLAPAKRVFNAAVAARDAAALREIDLLYPCTLSGNYEAADEGGPLVTLPPPLFAALRWLGPLAAAIAITFAYYSIVAARCETIPGCHTRGSYNRR